MPPCYDDVRKVFIHKRRISGADPSIDELMSHFGGGTRQTFVEFRRKLVREAESGRMPELDLPADEAVTPGTPPAGLPPALSAILTRLNTELGQVGSAIASELIRCRAEAGHQHSLELAALQKDQEKERQNAVTDRDALATALDKVKRERDDQAKKVSMLEEEGTELKKRIAEADRECSKAEAKADELSERVRDLELARTKALQQAAAAETRLEEALQKRNEAISRASAAEAGARRSEIVEERARLLQEQVNRQAEEIKKLQDDRLALASRCGALEQRVLLAEQAAEGMSTPAE